MKHILFALFLSILGLNSFGQDINPPVIISHDSAYNCNSYVFYSPINSGKNYVLTVEYFKNADSTAKHIFNYFLLDKSDKTIVKSGYFTMPFDSLFYVLPDSDKEPVFYNFVISQLNHL